MKLVAELTSEPVHDAVVQRCTTVPLVDREMTYRSAASALLAPPLAAAELSTKNAVPPGASDCTRA